VSENKKNVKKINKIVHPEVRLSIKKFIKKYKKKKAVVLDIPLLLEGKINNKRDILVFVESKKKEINKRLRKRYNFNLKVYKKLKKLQLPLETKKKKSNFIIKNNFKSMFVKKNVKIIKNKILKNERSSS
jgi:dephospho-CoA kinase